MSKQRDKINELMKRLQAGEKSCFAAIHNSTYNHLLSVAMHYLIDKSEAEDVLSESYLKMMKYLESADLTQDCYNWLCKIVQNTAYDFNQKRRKFLSLDDFAYTLPDPATSYAPEDWLERGELRDAIKKLKESDQKITYLYFFEGLILEDVAKRTNISKSTVSAHVKQIRKQLHGLLKEI
ncbi:MAG: sigma-70 family RNA polymerase sigma factor [Clostridia bacterium]|nr:sigma-70 family RNA polymerase sigma factor [Clostridia bacterium]